MNGFTSKQHYESYCGVADSFEGLPAPNLEQYPKDYGDYLHIRLLTRLFRTSTREF